MAAVGTPVALFRGQDRAVARVHGLDAASAIERRSATTGRPEGRRQASQSSSAARGPPRETVRVSKRILVTGGAGFVGTHLVAHLVERGDDVVVVDSLEPQVHLGREPVFPDGVSFIHGDVGDPVAADRALESVDAVVHLAAAVGVGQSMYEIERYVRVNTVATASFLERLVALPRRPERLVVASSMSIYGEGEYRCPEHGSVAPGLRAEEQLLARQWECVCPACRAELTPVPTRENKALIPTSVYAITKRDHEELCQVVGTAYGVPTVALRFFNIYGSGQALSNPYTGVAAIFSSRLLNSHAPLVFEDGLQSRDFVHVSDIVRAIVLALDSEDAVGHAINVGTGRPVTVREVAELLAAGLDSDIAPEFPTTYRMGDIRHCFADPTRAEELLGFKAEVRLEDGMGELLDWVRTQTATDRVEDAAAELVARRLVR
jgi:dTDP-L-rhamnose 4-epimerase